MKITQGQVSFLPDPQDHEIKGWSIGIEYTDDPHLKNDDWSMDGNPMFDLRDPAGVMMEVDACRSAHAGKYIRVLAFDSTARAPVAP